MLSSDVSGDGIHYSNASGNEGPNTGSSAGVPLQPEKQGHLTRSTPTPILPRRTIPSETRGWVTHRSWTSSKTNITYKHTVWNQQRGQPGWEVGPEATDLQLPIKAREGSHQGGSPTKIALTPVPGGRITGLMDNQHHIWLSSGGSLLVGYSPEWTWDPGGDEWADGVPGGATSFGSRGSTGIGCGAPRPPRPPSIHLGACGAGHRVPYRRGGGGVDGSRPTLRRIFFFGPNNGFGAGQRAALGWITLPKSTATSPHHGTLQPRQQFPAASPCPNPGPPLGWERRAGCKVGMFCVGWVGWSAGDA